MENIDYIDLKKHKREIIENMSDDVLNNDPWFLIHSHREITCRNILRFHVLHILKQVVTLDILPSEAWEIIFRIKFI